MNKSKKIIIGILIVLIIVVGIVVAYKIIENSVINRADFNFTVENISSSPVNTIDHGQNDTELKEAQQKITEGNKITGMTEVTGPGVIITLSDGKGVATSTLNPSQLIVHDLDVLSVVNELINAGAEAISINDQRWVLTTAISCRGNTIDINGERIGAPFTIKAIGLPEYLAGLERVGGYLEYMKQDGVGVKLEKSNSITIPKYSGVINFEYLQNVEE